MSRRRKNQKVVKMKRRQSVFLGFLLLVFAAYLLILFIQSLTREHISIYEVNEKQIADDETIRGIILRDEILVNAEQEGYVNYYVGEGMKVGVKSNVYSLDKNGSISEELSSLDTSDITLSEEDNRNIRDDIANFREGFELSDYNQIHNFRYNLDNTLLQLTTVNLADRLNQIMKEKGETSSSFRLIKAKKSGVVSFCTDGMEDLTVDTLTAKHFENRTDRWEQLRKTDAVKAGSPVYKLIESENWSVVVPLTTAQYEKIYDRDQLQVTLKKDNLQLNPSVTTFTINGIYYAKLDFDRYMIRYLNNRYLDVEIEFNDADGLKIPLSSILKKKCYVIPKEYLTEGSEEGGGGTGVFIQTYDKNGQPEKKFCKTEVYNIDEEGKAYIDAALFDAGTKLIKVGKGQSMTTEATEIAELEGVYNSNQGYCRFQIIEKLYENEEYAIVKKGTTYGLSAYDHIILNPEMIQENDIIY